MNYSELKSIIALYLKRSSLTARIPAFIQLAEARINRDVSVKDMVIRAETIAEAGARFITLPDDYKRVLRLEIDTASGRRQLHNYSYVQLGEVYPEGTTGDIGGYAVVGGEIEIRPVPAEEEVIYMTYYGKFASLSADTDTNDLLTSCPNIYVYATMIEATPFIQADERMPVWKELYQVELDNLTMAEEDALFSGGPLQITPIGISTP